MGRKKEFFFRCVGFKEVFDLLDLDRFDDILIEDMRRTDERVTKWLIEIFEGTSDRPVQKSKEDDDRHPKPIAKDSSSIGKSLGKMNVETAKFKYL
jgi:hypothetical protein